MGADELINEEAFDPEKLFNEEEYSTVIVNRDGFTGKENTAADLIDELLEPGNSRSDNEAIFKKLKDTGATKVLADAIGLARRNSDKAKLLAACWECGLDFTSNFLTFAKLACDPDFNVALEALTVVESCEGEISETKLNEALAFVKQSNSPNADLLNDLLNNIQQRFK